MEMRSAVADTLINAPDEKSKQKIKLLVGCGFGIERWGHEPVRWKEIERCSKLTKAT